MANLETPIKQVPPVSNRVLFSATATHFSESDKKTKITVSVTSRSIFLETETFPIREIAHYELEAITLSNVSSELIFHIYEDSDERITIESRKDLLIELLLYLKANGKDNDQEELSRLKIYRVEDETLELYVTTEDDLEDGHEIRPDEKYSSLVNYDDFNRFYNDQHHSSVDSEEAILKDNERGKKVKIEDFNLLQVLGKGAHGKVMLAEHIETKRQSAIKIIKKSHIIKAKQLEHTISEKNVLTTMRNNFIVDLTHCFQNKEKIYFSMEFMKGGELFQHLRKVKQFSEEETRFIAGCLVLALKHLHDNDFIYRDLKPENVLLDESGYCKLTDFGLSKKLSFEEKAKTFCGTPEYMSPEVILDKGCDNATDWWSLGVLIYEMIFGIPPFYSTNIQKMYKNTILKPLKFKKHTKISQEAKDFIGGLLIKDPKKRMGKQGGPAEIMAHSWFKNFDWNKLRAKSLKAMYQPFDCKTDWKQNFDPTFLNMKPMDSICEVNENDPNVIENDFKEFDYVSPSFIVNKEKVLKKVSGLLSTHASESEGDQGKPDSIGKTVHCPYKEFNEKKNIIMKKRHSEGSKTQRITLDSNDLFCSSNK